MGTEAPTTDQKRNKGKQMRKEGARGASHSHSPIDPGFPPGQNHHHLVLSRKSTHCRASGGLTERCHIFMKQYTNGKSIATPQSKRPSTLSPCGSAQSVGRRLARQTKARSSKLSRMIVANSCGSCAQIKTCTHKHTAAKAKKRTLR